jgi:uncharacterized protein (DUF2336 family)
VASSSTIARDQGPAELEAALAAVASGRLGDIARRITGLFLAPGAEFTEEQLALFGRLLTQLIDRIETTVLAELSERLATSPNSPAALVQRLARRDEIVVAQPVLAKSPSLTEEDLVEVSSTKSQAHLRAVSERRVLTQPVTDVLVVRGDDLVARRVTANPGARFSQSGFDVLSERAASDELLAESLAQRRDLPPHIYGQILVHASEAVRCRLFAAAPAGLHPELEKALGKVSGEIADQAPLPRDYGSAIRRILLAFPEGRIEEPDLLKLVLGKQHEDVVAALSILTTVSVRTIDQLMNEARLEPLQFLCKALGFGWTCTRSLLQMRGRIPAEDLAVARADFEQIPVEAAKRMVSVWRNRDNARGD